MVVDPPRDGVAVVEADIPTGQFLVGHVVFGAEMELAVSWNSEPSLLMASNVAERTMVYVETDAVVTVVDDGDVRTALLCVRLGR